MGHGVLPRHLVGFAGQREQGLRVMSRAEAAILEWQQTPCAVDVMGPVGERGHGVSWE